MRRIRIHVELALAEGADIVLPAAAAGHVARVLRLAAGDGVTLFNGDGNDYAAELVTVDRRAVTARVQAVQAVANESPLALTLAQGLARGEKMDLVVQKATELGVARIVPLLSERSEVRLDSARSDKRLQHWRAIAAGACEQCGRARVPAIAAPRALDEWAGSLDGDGVLRLALLPDARHGPRGLAVPSAGAILVAGPEGGLGDRDVATLRAAGFAGLRLGPRILRTETAGLAALAALQALYGDL
ncbi:MAG TPA: 16S rRNA (uracil(1498)-N(3))-methyltransferase [Rhodanobacteraceae bacterium]|nr:16S rRNA (uracil(1498)-N(3))-methyltransferase [Rhodanobacteraceae bacterium]